MTDKKTPEPCEWHDDKVLLYLPSLTVISIRRHLVALSVCL